MANNLFITAIVFGSPSDPTVSLQISAIVRPDAETAVAQNVASFISEYPGWNVNLVQCVALPQEFLQRAITQIVEDKPADLDGATVLRLVPSASKRRGRPKKLSPEAHLTPPEPAA